jgi:hypothetical protein
MFVRYQIEPVGKKHGWRQGSSDCWYYAAKSLLRFYGLGNKDSKSDQVYAHLQIAKLIRLFKIEMRAVYGKDVYRPMQTTDNLKKWIDEEIGKIEKTRGAIVGIADQESGVHKSIKELLTSQDLWTTENILKLSSTCKQLDGILGGMNMSSISAKRYTLLRVGQMTCIYEAKWRGKNWNTGEVFASAFPPSLFEAVSLDEKTAEGLYKALEEHGPLWACGNLAAENTETYSIVTHSPEGDSVDTRNLVQNYISDAAHAVTVYGVNTESKMVEYADPNDFTTPRRVQAAMFLDHLTGITVNSKSISLLKVKCDGADAVLKRRRIAEW